MTQTFADELFNNLSKLKGGYKLDTSKRITLECNPEDIELKTTLYFYGLDYNIGSGTNKGNFIIGEKVAEIEISKFMAAEKSGNKSILIFNFNSNKMSGYISVDGEYYSLYDSPTFFPITSKTFYSVSHPYPALFITSSNLVKNNTYDSKLNTAISEINTNILNEGVIYTIPDFVREE